MVWIQAIQYVLTETEARITDSDLCAESFAQELFVSAPHLQRAFNILTGYSIGEYIRNRRLSLAATDLLAGASVMEVALKFGYDSPEAFTKAFKRFHNGNPSDVKRGRTQLLAFPPLHIELTLKGDVAMNYKIVEKEGFYLVGKGFEVSTEHGENQAQIPLFWAAKSSDGTVDKLIKTPGIQELVGACIMEDLSATTFTYGVAGLFDHPVELEGYTIWPVEPLTWAVFESVGPMPGAIQETWHRIFAEWFPATGFSHGKGPELEIYPEGDTASADYRCEIWIPIVKK